MAAIALKNNDFEALTDKIIADPQTWRAVAEVIFDLVDQNKRIDMPELMAYLKTTQPKE